jgi:hypothetical protein
VKAGLAESGFDHRLRLGDGRTRAGHIAVQRESLRIHALPYRVAPSLVRVITIDVGLTDAVQSFVAANVARMNETPHYSLGFVILHHGSATKSLLTQWWVNECVCMQHVAQSPLSGPPRFSAAKPGLMACAYELVLIDFERRAWVSTVMSGQPREAYLGAWPPDGLY